jgi:hypothetical protein
MVSTIGGWVAVVLVMSVWVLVIWSIRDVWSLLQDVYHSFTVKREFDAYAHARRSHLYK